MFITSDKPTRMSSTKSVTEKPKYSKCRNRPTNMPKAIDSMPIAKMVSSLRRFHLTSVAMLFGLAKLITLFHLAKKTCK